MFGQVVITSQDLEDWVRAVAPHIAHSDWRIRNYIRDYRVAEKVRAAKLAGVYHDVISSGRPAVDRCAACGRSFHLGG